MYGEFPEVEVGSCKRSSRMEASRGRRLNQNQDAQEKMTSLLGFWCAAEVYVGIPLDFTVDDWWIWLLLGLQSAFYTYSMARLPQVLGYSVSFVLVITGLAVAGGCCDHFRIGIPYN